jgi:hypothetical protein
MPSVAAGSRRWAVLPVDHHRREALGSKPHAGLAMAARSRSGPRRNDFCNFRWLWSTGTDRHRSAALVALVDEPTGRVIPGARRPTLRVGARRPRPPRRKLRDETVTALVECRCRKKGPLSGALKAAALALAILPFGKRDGRLASRRFLHPPARQPPAIRG